MTTIAALGDSIAYGVGDTDSRVTASSWSGRLACTIQADKHQRFAWPGARIQDVAKTQVAAVLITRPDIILISVGGNDAVRRGFCPRKFSDQLHEVVEKLERTQAKIVVLNLQDVSRTCPVPGPVRRALAYRVQLLNNAIRESTAHTTAVILDRWNDPTAYQDDYLSIDRVHPSPRGYQQLARSTAQLLGHNGSQETFDFEDDTARRTLWVATKGVPWVLKRSTRLVPGFISIIRQGSGTGSSL
ncbi:MAG: SGNH/GDSL hydrolase family protein [Actinomycetes bacterium]